MIVFPRTMAPPIRTVMDVICTLGIPVGAVLTTTRTSHRTRCVVRAAAAHHRPHRPVKVLATAIRVSTGAHIIRAAPWRMPTVAIAQIAIAQPPRPRIPPNRPRRRAHPRVWRHRRSSARGLLHTLSRTASFAEGPAMRRRPAALPRTLGSLPTRSPKRGAERMGAGAANRPIRSVRRLRPRSRPLRPPYRRQHRPKRRP